MKSDLPIPLLDWNAFQEAFFERNEDHTGPTAAVSPAEISYFEIRRREAVDQHCKLTVTVSRRRFYMISLMTRGTVEYTCGKEVHILSPNTLYFVHPAQVASWRPLTDEQQGFYCLFSADYFLINQHTAHPLAKYPLFSIEDSQLMVLNEQQVATFTDLFTKLETEHIHQHSGYAEALKMYLNVLLIEALRIRPKPAQAFFKDALAPVRLTKVFFKRIEDNFLNLSAGNALAERTVGQYAAALHVHPNHLNATIKQTTGRTASDFIHERLAQEAQLLVQQAKLSITEIAYQLGFENQSYFSRFFKKHTRLSPSEYRAILIR